jgi:DNA-binding response OmpR family regulator
VIIVVPLADPRASTRLKSFINLGVLNGHRRGSDGRVGETTYAMTSVLLIEDDPEIRAALACALSARNFAVFEAGNGLTGLQELIDHNPEIVVLDLGLPDIDGIDLLRMLRSVSAVPVIVATARDDEVGIVALLDAGADDYVVKPFSSEQIEARVRSILRRVAGGLTNQSAGIDGTIVAGALLIAPRQRSVTLNGRTLSLSRKEFDLLHYLALRAGTVVTKQELVMAVWKQPYIVSERTIDTHLSWLRAKLGETATDPRYLHTVRGVGVKFVSDVS